VKVSESIQKRLKRVVDIAGSGAALFVAAPALVGTACLVRTTMGSPVFFRQQRPGRDGKPFTLVKFRTMAVAKGNQGIESDGMRLTTVGTVLRSLSLDELPTLWNVFRGDMSLVGPRPLLMQYLKRYSAEEARRHEVVPGVTGWAQINGRNALSWQEKFAYDVWYVDNWSLALDFTILWRTVSKVLLREDIASEGAATMTEFLGTDTKSSSGPSEGA
tara:strand:- start:72206 stop:72856 length:651 start_codon:yes stop_codon:yes gene_type:complete